jgi:hypothetical protein
MLNAESIKQVHLAPGATDLRKSIDGLSAIVSAVFELDPFSDRWFECLLDCTRFGKAPSSGADHAPISSTVR